jgi:hypothetical protein
VTAVYHPDCPLTEDDELTKVEMERAHRRYPGFDAPPLRHRVTQVYHPDCPLEPETLLTDSEKRQYGTQYAAVDIEETKPETTDNLIEAERFDRIIAVNHPDFPRQVGERLTLKDASRYRRQYKGFDVECYYEVTHIEDGIPELTVGQHLTEAEYKELRRSNADLAKRVASPRYRVECVHHPKLDLEVDTELTKEEFQKYNRKFKGFDTEIDSYRVIEDKRNTDTPFETDNVLPPKEYRDLNKASKQAIYTLTHVYPKVMKTDTSNPNRDHELERARFVPSGHL